MANKNKAPIDQYSQAEYQKGLDQIDAVLAHPLHGELEQHRKWRAEAGDSPYPLVEDELRAMDIVEEDTGVVNGNIAHIEMDLKRQMSNAIREASGEYEEREGQKIAAELLPKIERMRMDTEEILERIGDPLHPRADFLGNKIIAEAERAKQEVAKSTQPRLGAVIMEIFRLIEELYGSLKRFVTSFLAQDRFGKNKESS
jgi:hypothetical protein